MKAGYSEKFRIEISSKVISKYEEKLERDRNGEKAVYRDNKERERDREMKKMKKNDWFKKGRTVFDGVIRIPMTPNSELTKRIQRKLCGEDTKFKVMVQEQVGQKVSELLSNATSPWPKTHCCRPNCIMCDNGNYKDCWRSNVTYILSCKVCQEEGRTTVYHGESSRGLYCRLQEHLGGLALGTTGKVMWDHKMSCHKDMLMGPEHWLMEATGVYNTVLQRQTAEGVHLEEEMRKKAGDGGGRRTPSQRKIILNSKKDFVQTGLVRDTPRRLAQDLEG